jgi:hypothetical protein
VQNNKIYINTKNRIIISFFRSVDSGTWILIPVLTASTGIAVLSQAALFAAQEAGWAPKE